MVVLLKKWLYLSTNLCSSEDGLNEISLKMCSFSRHTFRNRSKKNLNWASSSWLTFCLPDQGHFLFVLVADFVRGWLSWTLSHWVRRLWKLPAQRENLWICPGPSDGTFFGPSVTLLAVEWSCLMSWSSEHSMLHISFSPLYGFLSTMVKCWEME